MNRVVNTCEKNITPLPANVIVVGAGASTNVLEDIAAIKGEYAGRYIQNVGANNCFYAFGQDCDNNLSYHGYLVPGQQLDCSNHGRRVSVYSVAGTSIAPTVLIRTDNTTQQNIRPL